MSVTIRPATAADAAAVHACLATAFAPFEAAYTPAAYEDTVLDGARFTERLAGSTILVAETSPGTVAGTIGYRVATEGQGHLRGMGVLPAHQGSGIADALLTAAEEGLRRAGCVRALLNSTAPLQRAIAFYERRGYRATGRSRDWLGMPLYEYAKELR